MHSPNRLIKVVVIGIAMLAILLYGFYEFRGYIYGPTLQITTPKNGDVIADGAVVVSGTALGINEITLNGRSIFVDEKGVFNETISLMSGYNILTVEVADRFGNHKKEVREVIAKPTISPEAPDMTKKEAEKTGTTTEHTDADVPL